MIRPIMLVEQKDLPGFRFKMNITNCLRKQYQVHQPQELMREKERKRDRERNGGREREREREKEREDSLD